MVGAEFPRRWPFALPKPSADGPLSGSRCRWITISRGRRNTAYENRNARRPMERAAAWPAEAQAELLRSELDIELRYLGVYPLSDDDRAALARSPEDVRPISLCD